jgi:hypothetical protein
MCRGMGSVIRQADRGAKPREAQSDLHAPAWYQVGARVRI